MENYAHDQNKYNGEERHIGKLGEFNYRIHKRDPPECRLPLAQRLSEGYLVQARRWLAFAFACQRAVI
jgi:hypothetical protein